VEAGGPQSELGGLAASRGAASGHAFPSLRSDCARCASSRRRRSAIRVRYTTRGGKRDLLVEAPRAKRGTVVRRLSILTDLVLVMAL
jgi:hypothetical protein